MLKNLEPPDYSGELIRITLDERIRHNPSYSLRAFARDLGVSHSYLSLVMSGRKKISLKRVRQFSDLLRLDESQSKLFRESVAKSHLQNDGGLHRLKPTADDWYVLEVDRFKFLAEWYHIAILEFLLLALPKKSPTAIAKALNIRIQEVRDALERLQRLGLVTCRKGKWTKVSPQVAIPVTAPNSAIRRFHAQMIQKALGALALESEFGARDITGTTIPANPKHFPEAKRRIAKFRKSLMKFLSQGECTTLYQLNVQLFRLSNGGKNEA